MSVDPQHRRMVEALLFAAAEPLDAASMMARLPDEVDVAAVLADLGEHYRGRGVNLVQVAGRWALRTAPDLAFLLEEERQVTRRLSRAAVETLAIVAYHQPITRAEIEEVRGVAVSKGTLDVLMEAGWVRMRGRRRTPGRPITYGTTDEFLIHFGLDSLDDLPGVDELKAAGMLEAQPALAFSAGTGDEDGPAENDLDEPGEDDAESLPSEGQVQEAGD